MKATLLKSSTFACLFCFTKPNKFVRYFQIFCFSTFFSIKIFAQTFNTNIPVAIPVVGTATSDITVNGVGNLGASNCKAVLGVTIDITHTWTGDIGLFLISPSNQILELSTGNGGAGNNYTNTTFIDSAPTFITIGTPPYTGSFRPEGKTNIATPPYPPVTLGTYTFANTFNGGNADGVWKLYVNDFIGIDFGTINSWSITFGNGNNLNVNAGADQNICVGQTATLSANGGTNYSWSNGSNSASISVTPNVTTTYTVTATNPNGCLGTDEVKVTVSTLPDVTLPTQNNCTGQSVTLTANNGSNYLWNTGATTQSISVSPSATTNYSVTLTNTVGCQLINKVIVNTGLPTSISLVEDVTICQGQQATLANPLGYLYQWQTGQVVSSINVFAANTSYLVTISNPNGSCPKVKTFNINLVPQAQINLGPDIALCGSVSTTLTANGGGTYQWSSGQTSSSITVNPSNTSTYIVTVTPAGTNCPVTDDIKITVNPIPIANAGLDKSICIGKSTTLTASGGQNYTWSTGSNSSSNSVSPIINTTYTVTVSNAFGCSSTDDVSVNVNPSPTASATPDLTICSGTSVPLTASGGQTYAWSNGQNNQNINPTPSSSTVYTVTISDANACTAVAQTQVTVNTVTANAGNDLNICNGQSVTLTALGSPNTTFAWSNGTTTAINTVTPSSTTTYSVTVSDALGCSKTDEVVVNIVAPPVASLSADVTICSGQSATLNASGGNAFAWSTGQNSPSISVAPLVNTSYTVSVSNGICSDSKQVQVSVQPKPIVLINAPSQLCSGQATLDAGSGFATYNWSNGQNTSSINITQAGTYSVVATDAFGCSNTAQVFVNDAPKPTFSGIKQICPNSSTSISINELYANYTWSDGQNGQNVNFSQAGNYSVTATNFQGCSVVSSIFISAANAPNLTLSGTLGICPNESTTLSAFAQNASYQWSNGASSSFINISSAGAYSVTATNTSACTATSSVFVSVFNNPNVKIQGNNTICASGGNVTLSTNGNFSQYQWTNNSKNPTFQVTQSGNYSVTVTDNNGCKATDQFFISPQSVVPQIAGSTSFCPGNSTTLSANAANAVSYLWSNGATTANAKVSTAGNISVTVTDNKGCKGSADLTVTLSSSLSPTITGKKQICEGAETTFDAGAGFQTYLWNDGSVGSTLKTSKSGTYSVTVNDGACSGSAGISLDVVKNNIKIAFEGDSLICPNSTTTLSVANNFSTYLWNNNNGTNSISNISAGVYKISVTDNFGCLAEKSILVKNTQNPMPKILGNNTFCLGGFTTLSSEKYNTYLWSTAAKDSFLTINTAGQYGLTVTDFEGCVGSTFVNVTQINGLTPPILGSKILCKGEKITLQTANYKTYLWSNGSLSNSIEIDKSGKYKVSVSDVAGCIGENEITVVEQDLEKPKIIGDTLFCEGKNTTLSISNSNKFNTFEWSNGVKNNTINVSKSDTYIVSVSDGVCKSSNTIFVNVVKNNLKGNIIGDSILCENEKTILSNSDKNVLTYTWKNTSQAVLSQDTISTKGNITWSLTVSDKFGCSATSSLKIVEISLPKTNIKGDTLIINATPTLLDAGAGFSSYLWNTGESTQSINITQSGIYTVIITNKNGCKNVASINVKSINFIKPAIGGKDKICKNEKVTLVVANTFDTYLWSNGEKLPAIEVSKGGTYYVTVTKGTLVGKDTFVVQQSILNPSLLAKNYNGFGVSCESNQDGEIKVENLNGAINPLTFKWSNGVNTAFVNNLKSGIYKVSISDAFACEWVGEISLSAPEKISFQTTVIPLNCKSTNSAEIKLENTNNAIFPLKIKLNQEELKVQQLPFSFKNLSEGNYNLQLSDANNCSLTQNILIEKQLIPTVSLGDDIEVYAGDEIQLLAQSNIAPIDIFWTKIGELSCKNCMNPIAKPSKSGEYQIRIKDKFNCEASDIIRIIVNKDLYVPTAFTPNNDQINDFFTVFGNKSVKEILYLRIFDRWGNLVFQGDNSNSKWDGTFNNIEVQAGVFIFNAKILFKDNSEQLIKGEVTLTR